MLLKLCRYPFSQEANSLEPGCPPPPTAGEEKALRPQASSLPFDFLPCTKNNLGFKKPIVDQNQM